MPFTKDDPNINRNGRPKGSGLSITALVKKELEKCPKGEDTPTYADLVVKKILSKAVKEGDAKMIEKIWAYIDGLPKQAVDVTSRGEQIGMDLNIDLKKLTYEELQALVGKEART